MTQSEKEFLLQIMMERIEYHGMNISPEYLENEKEALNLGEILMEELKKSLSEEEVSKVIKYVDIISNIHAYDSDYFYQRGFEDGLLLAKAVYGFEPSESLSVIANRMKKE